MRNFDIYDPMDGMHSADGISDLDGDDENEENERKYVFTISVSMPVLGKDINATLLGVAGIDVPVIEFQRILKLYMVSNFILKTDNLIFFIYSIDWSWRICIHNRFQRKYCDSSRFSSIREFFYILTYFLNSKLNLILVPRKYPETWLHER